MRKRSAAHGKSAVSSAMYVKHDTPFLVSSVRRNYILVLPRYHTQSPNAILQWAQSKCKVIEEAQNQTQLSGISEDLPDHSLEGSPIGQDDRQNSGFSID
eukprot:gb/GECG01004914.1/.p1 GENE.gb/GECG01004914.1/~~gb/GECG01004914.1/.p1  ORF type:complete len:100 (+),score=10.49 gb/GECG01004914.1/:1-300(+)